MIHNIMRIISPCYPRPVWPCIAKPWPKTPSFHFIFSSRSPIHFTLLLHPLRPPLKTFQYFFLITTFHPTILIPPTVPPTSFYCIFSPHMLPPVLLLHRFKQISISYPSVTKKKYEEKKPLNLFSSISSLDLSAPVEIIDMLHGVESMIDHPKSKNRKINRKQLK